MANGNGIDLFKSIVERANTKLNGEKAAKIKRSLIGFGALGCAIGIIVLFIGIFLFASVGVSVDFSPGHIAGGMVLFMLGGIIIMVGTSAISAGVKIVVAGVAADIGDTLKKCPKCGDKVEPDEDYCDKCGTPLLKQKLCTCGKQNELDSTFCRSCGKHLN